MVKLIQKLNAINWLLDRGHNFNACSTSKNVFAIEEVHKYAEAANFLVHSFGLEKRINIKPISLYSCNSNEFFDQFDITYFPSVIYHFSDPVLALRILFNATKINGYILIESAGLKSNKSFCRFDGSLIHTEGNRGKLNRKGWNWFIPSKKALEWMLREVGFEALKLR